MAGLTHGDELMIQGKTMPSLVPVIFLELFLAPCHGGTLIPEESNLLQVAVPQLQLLPQQTDVLTL